MLASFLSPSFAWHAHAGHHEIADESRPAHDHEHAGHAHDEESTASDAHASIGHLLGHLSMQMTSIRVTVPVHPGAVAFADPHAPPPAFEHSPPYRPPLGIRPA